MFSKLCLKCVVCAVAALLANPGVARAYTWSSPRDEGDCGCSEPAAPMNWTQPLTGSPIGHPFGMRPAPPYNTTWARVPVTNYRTQVVNDPLSGVSTTASQPCNTYEMQMRRTAGCSLWQSFVNWWQCQCCCLRGRSMPAYETMCDSTSEWSTSAAPQPAASPYYVPSNSIPQNNAPTSNGRLVPVPSSASPTSPAPADRRPELSPIPPRSGGENSASRVVPLDTEVFVRTLDTSEILLELTPPLVAPGVYDVDAELNDEHREVIELPEPTSAEQPAAIRSKALELLPVSWSTPSASEAGKLPTNEVWDDTGWRSEQ